MKHPAVRKQYEAPAAESIALSVRDILTLSDNTDMDENQGEWV